MLQAEIEECLNSRLLTTNSSDPNASNSLTLESFFTKRTIKILPTIDYTLIPDNRQKHWQKTQKLMQLFWKYWSIE